MKQDKHLLLGMIEKVETREAKNWPEGHVS
jgi:hypothetical protein